MFLCWCTPSLISLFKVNPSSVESNAIPFHLLGFQDLSFVILSHSLCHTFRMFCSVRTNLHLPYLKYTHALQTNKTHPCLLSWGRRKSSGDGRWWSLHNNVNVLNATELSPPCIVCDILLMNFLCVCVCVCVCVCMSGGGWKWV